MARRFSTWFFAADLPSGAAVSFIGDEVAEHRWLTAHAALEQLAAGEIGMWVPTTSILERLIASGASSAADIEQRVRLGPIAPPETIVEGPARTQIRSGSAGGLPGRQGRATLHGLRELVLVDPGDSSDAALDAIAAAVRRRNGLIRAIVLTAPDPDHAAAAEAVAIPLGIPILVAPGAGHRLPYAVRELRDDESLPADVALRVRLGPPGAGTLEVIVGDR